MAIHLFDLVELRVLPPVNMICIEVMSYGLVLQGQVKKMKTVPTHKKQLTALSTAPFQRGNNCSLIELKARVYRSVV